MHVIVLKILKNKTKVIEMYLISFVTVIKIYLISFFKVIGSN